MTPYFPFTLSASASTNSSNPNLSSLRGDNTSSQTKCDDDVALSQSLAVLYSLIFLFGLVGNLFALWVFLFLHSSRNSVRVFLINCAVADMVLLACLPFRIFYHINSNKWALGPVPCKMVGNLFYMNMYISIMLLGLISLDRYVRLKGKGQAQRVRRPTLWGRRWPWSTVVCGAMWGVSLTVMVAMVSTPEDEDNDSDKKCFQYKQRSDKAKEKAYFNGAIVLFFWLVFIMLVASYAKIASQLLRVARDRPDLPNAQRYGRTAKKSFFVLFLFTVCFGPYHAFRPVYIFYQLSGTISCPDQQMVYRANEVMLLFSAFNSCLDPVMYFLLSGSVRKAALRALGHRIGRRLPFLNDATSNSSMEFRRGSTLSVFPHRGANTPSGTPRTSICAANSTLRCTGLTTLSPNWPTVTASLDSNMT